MHADSSGEDPYGLQNNYVPGNKARKRWIYNKQKLNVKSIQKGIGVSGACSEREWLKTVELN